MGEYVYFLVINQLRLMSQMIRYRNRGKGVSIKLGDPMTDSHGLDVVKKLHPILLMLTNGTAWDTQQGCSWPACTP
jgi:hypothetical protein